MGQGLFQGNVELCRYEFGDAVHFGVRNIHHASHVPDGGFRAQRPERDDLAHVVFAVFLDHVIDDFSPAVHAEIHVDVRHAHAFGIEEPFKEQVVREWIQVGNAESIGNQTPGRRSSTRSHRNAA